MEFLLAQKLYTGVSIAHDSMHPAQHKVAVVNHAIHRLVHLPLSNDEILKETQAIQYIASLNGLRLDILKMIRRKRLKLLLTEDATSPANPPRTRCIRLPYLGKLSNQLSRELRRCDYRVGFYPHTTVNQLSTLKDKIPPAKRSGIYRLTCGECPSLYIGQTGRKFSTCLSDHQTAYNKKKPKDSAMTKHCLETGHNFANISTDLVCSSSKGRFMNQAEEVETIYSHKISGKICSTI